MIMGSIAHPAPLEMLAREAALKLRRSEEYKTSAAILLTDCHVGAQALDYWRTCCARNP